MNITFSLRLTLHLIARATRQVAEIEPIGHADPQLLISA